jgi:very-short-patch-repair endonuclease
MPANLQLQQKHPLKNYDLPTPALSFPQGGTRRGSCQRVKGLNFFQQLASCPCELNPNHPSASSRPDRRRKGIVARVACHRFAGFKFRRQHPAGIYILDYYCAAARLDVELDGFQHGLPEQMQHDEARSVFLKEQDIEELRFWNHQWRENREGCLLAIWDALQHRTGCVQVMKNVEEQRFVPPHETTIKRPSESNPSPRPSPRLAERGR